jgi:hypothetical protein
MIPDPEVLRAARLMLETAARRLHTLERLTPGTLNPRLANQTLSEVKANIEAALARL